MSWSAKAVLSLAAATVSGALTGTMLAVLGSAVAQDVRAAFSMLAVALVAVLAWVPGLPLPQYDSETEQSLLNRGAKVWAILNGALLGLGFASRIGYWIWYVIPILCFAVGQWWIGGAVYAVYGLARLGWIAAVAWHVRRQGYEWTLALLAPNMKRRAHWLANGLLVPLAGTAILVMGLHS